MHKNRRLVNLLKLALSAGLLVLLLAQIRPQQAVAMLASARWPYLGLALALYISGIALRALRWQALLQAKGVTVPLPRLVMLYYVGSFFNIMLPTGIGGDAIRAYELARYTSHPETAVGTVFLDRAAGLVMLLCMAALVLPFRAALLPLWMVVLVLGLTLASLAVLGLLFWGEPLRRLYHALPERLQRLIGHPSVRRLFRSLSGYPARPLALALGVSVAFNLLLIAVNVLIGLGLSIHSVTLGHYVVFVSLISVTSALPISLGGWGVREGGYAALFPQVGVSTSTAVLMGLIFDVINALGGLIGGVLYAWEGARGAWRSVPKEVDHV